MLNYLWAFMLLLGILWGAFTGQIGAVTEGALNSAKEAISLCITMLGVMSLWTGILEVGQRSGLIEAMAHKMSPILTFLFPRIPKDHESREFIATNMIANILGLGWAATPAGLAAMEKLEELEEERREAAQREEDTRVRAKARQDTGNAREPMEPGRFKAQKAYTPVPSGTASNEMCNFLIINISSLQLIPINMIAYRSQYGSVNPTAIVGPAIAATMFSTLVGVVFCKVMERKRCL